MDVNEYIKSSFKLWKLDEEEALKLREEEYPIKYGFFLVLIIYLVITLISFLIEFSSINDIMGLFSPFALISLIIFLIFLIGFIFLSFLWSHMWIKIFGGDENLKKTVEVFLILFFPITLVSFILTTISSILEITIGENLISLLISAIIYLLVGIYNLIIIVKTFSITHNLGILKSFFAGLTSMIIIYIIIAIVLVLLAFLIGINPFYLNLY